MLTGLNTARTAFAAKGTGAFDYVTKPFDVEELRLRVEHALEVAQGLERADATAQDRGLGREVHRLADCGAPKLSRALVSVPHRVTRFPSLRATAR